MNRINLFQFEIEADKFEHFLKGDGEIYFDNDDGVFLTREELEAAFKENHLETIDEKNDYMSEFSICGDYNDLVDQLDYYYDGDYALEYIKVGNTVVMSMAYNIL